jgi:hypothetical protein
MGHFTPEGWAARPAPLAARSALGPSGPGPGRIQVAVQVSRRSRTSGARPTRRRADDVTLMLDKYEVVVAQHAKTAGGSQSV